MYKEEVKKRLEEGTIQIENDAPDRLELLRELINWTNGYYNYYILEGCLTDKFKDKPIIKLSDIEEEQWQISTNSKDWYDVGYKCRIKPQPNYTNEIKALQNKAKENGQKVVIVFEKL